MTLHYCPLCKLLQRAEPALAYCARCGDKLRAVDKPPVGTGAGKRFSGFTLPDGESIWGDFDADASEPIEVREGIWVFRRMCFQVEGAENEHRSEIVLRVKHAAYRREKALEKVRKEVAAFENFERLPSARRERIPESVRLFVWQRDCGRCVKCGSSERLEFDHIIPVAEGGSSTERNIQLLCETCNRTKGKSI